MSITSTTAHPGARIQGLGHFRPSRVVTNDELSQQIDTSDEWIRTRVGVVERRYATENDTIVSMGAAAAKEALAEANLAAEDVDLIMVANCTGEVQIPHAATPIAKALGIRDPGPGAMDINAACAGFCYGLGTAASLVTSGAARNVLLIGSEQLTNWVDPTDRANAIIFGDGAAAAVVVPSDTPHISPIFWGSSPDSSEVIYTDGGRRGYIFQEGQAVFRWATTAIWKVAVQAAQRAGVELSEIDVIAPHQANLRIIDAIAKKLIKAGARPDVAVARDIVTTGNTSSASIPIALDRMRKADQIAPGSLVLAVGFGAGLTYAGQVFRLP